MAERKLVSFDWALKKLLRSKVNFEILEGFLSELLNDDIKIQEVLESESNRETEKTKQNRIDLKVKNNKDEIVIIEVQYEREFDFLQRILFGVSKTISENLDKGDKYSNLTKVYSVSILYFDFGQGADYIYRGTTSFRGLYQNDELQLSKLQKKRFNKEFPCQIFPEHYLLRVNSFNDIARTSLDEWMYFLKNEEIKSDFKAKGLIRAKEELDILKLSEEERRVYERYSDDLHYQASLYESNYEFPYQEGLEKGLEKGLKKGKDQEKIETARRMLVDGFEEEKISRYSGLPIDEIRKLKEG
ncbi:MAG: Rpn family recombination-promoting nuclease/putative transposase [Candidatus Riflebacteria bacterium]|nr:Rpn family recombination-promoting nuclease/putative transposase [Candidatus Riflebacteria bacterium]